MKIGVSSYSFSQYIRQGKLDQFGTIAEAAELGFDAIEFAGLSVPEGMTDIEYAQKLKAEADRCDIEVSAYVVGANLAVADKEKFEEEVEKLKKGVDIANILGAKFFRHDVMYDYKDFRSFSFALPTIADAARRCTEYAEGLGIKTMTENHGLIFQDPQRMELLVSAVNHPNYGLLIDMGNFLCADCNPHLAISALANQAFFVHAKDFKVYDYSEGVKEGIETRACNRIQGVASGDGDVDVARCLAILKKANYDGYIDVEYEGNEDCIEGIKRSLVFIKKHIGC